MTLVESQSPVTTAPPKPAAPVAKGRLGRFETFGIALVGVLLLWLAFPPFSISLLAWIAPLPWLWLITREKLTGRRPYLQIYVAGFALWMLLLNWLRLPHWATACFGWPAISLYLAIYLPLFVGLSRVAVWRLRVPLIIAAPAVWIGLELLRGHLLTGFSMLLLGHTQVKQLPLIQISDLGGAYAVSLLVVLVASALATLLPRATNRRQADQKSWLPTAASLMLAAVAMAAALGYGIWRLGQPLAGQDEPSPRIVLVQGSIDTVFGDEAAKPDDVHQHYVEISQDAAEEFGTVDLFVWPESMYTQRLHSGTADAVPPPGMELTAEEFAAKLEYAREVFSSYTLYTAGRQLNTPMLVGSGRIHFTADRVYDYNSALLLTPEGEVAQSYDKMHPVMFGEYVPLGDLAPFIYQFMPIRGGLTPGAGPVVIPAGDWQLAPNICFESTVPHLIREQVNTLTAAGTPPDALVNLTNDGWFWGSAELDAHLNCSVFRAVECRLPVLVAANTGFSASIDGDGRILEQGPRHATGYILARPTRDGRESLYLKYGDWLAGACLVFCGVLACVGLVGGWRGRRAAATG